MTPLTALVLAVLFLLVFIDTKDIRHIRDPPSLLRASSLDLLQSPPSAISLKHHRLRSASGRSHSKKETRNNTITQRQVPGAPAPALPQTWQFQNFEEAADEEQYENEARTAVVDALNLATSAIQALNQETLSTSFHRYFQTEDRPLILEAYLQIIRELLPSSLTDNTGSSSPDDCSDSDEDDTPNLLIHYDDPIEDEGAESEICATEEQTLAYYRIIGPKQNWELADWSVVLCDQLFAQTTIPPSNAAIECDTLADYSLVEQLETPGATVLHEFMHAPSVGNVVGAPGRDAPQIVDYRVVVDGVTHWIYGPYWSQFLNENDPVYGRSLWNADNYMWFAIETHFGVECGGKVFRDAPDDGSDQRSHGANVPQPPPS